MPEKEKKKVRQPIIGKGKKNQAGQEEKGFYESAGGVCHGWS